MKIIKVEQSMLCEVSELCTEIYIENYADHWIDNDPSQYIQEQYSESSLALQLANNSNYYIAVDNEYSVGFMKLNFDIKAVLKNIRTMEIEKIYFRLDAQGKGYGSKMLKFAMDIAKEKLSKSVQLDVLTSNLKARKFYQKHGFREHATTSLDHPKFRIEHRPMKIMLKAIE